MLTRQQQQTTQDLLAAADLAFENADALAATEHLRAAMVHTLTVIATRAGSMTGMTCIR